MIRVLLQARTDSSRLPGKALLPISGIPCAILACLRAASPMFDVRLLTSEESSDDLLADTAASYKIEVFRGSKNNVLSRFVGAVADLHDEDWVFRLTGDNPVVDANFLHRLVALAEQEQVDFVGTRSPEDGLPYGLSAELMKVKDLRAASTSNPTTFQQEHVTPWIYQNRKTVLYRQKDAPENWPGLRCTVDSFDDYERVAKAFQNEGDPVAVPFARIIEKLSKNEGAAQFRVHPGFVLGTVQLGLPYGSRIKGEWPDLDTSVAIVREAIDHGCGYIDTARAYGESESRIGEALRGSWGSRATVITKTSPILADGGVKENLLQIENGVYQSLRNLKLESLPVLLVHHVDQISNHDGALWEHLLKLQSQGLGQKLGASVQTPAELLSVLKIPEIRWIQLPYNLLDRRWDSDEVQRAIQSRAGDVVIHARSVYLQGTLAQDDPEKLPEADGVDRPGLMHQLSNWKSAFNRKSLADLCLAFVRARSWIDGQVIGTDSLTSLRSTLSNYRGVPLTEDQATEILSGSPLLPEEFLNPAKWR